MYGSHDVRQVDFRRLTVVNETLRFWGVTQIVLGVMDLDLALRVSSPAPLTVESSFDEKRDIER